MNSLTKILLAGVSSLALASEPAFAAYGENGGSLTGLNSLSAITPPSTASYRLNLTGSLLITANDNSFLVSGATTPFQGFRLNYTSTQNWATDVIGPVSFATISATMSGYSGATYGKGVSAFNVAFSPLAGYDGHEMYAATFGIVSNATLNTVSDLVALSAGVTLNNTTELSGASGSHIYGLFGTTNVGPLGVAPIINGVDVEQGISSGGVILYVNGAHVVRNGSAPESGQLVAATAMITGAQYSITSLGTSPTNFVALGATANTVGLPFVYNGATATGNGTATSYPWSSAFSVSAAGLGASAQAYLAFLSLEDVTPHIGNSLPQALQPGGMILAYDNQTPCTSNGAIVVGSNSNNGTGYTPGTYTNVAVTGGSGAGALANVTVGAAGTITSFVIVGTSKGLGYLVNDSVSVAASSIGGTGSGFAWVVTQVALPGPINNGAISAGGSAYTPTSGTQQYTLVPLTVGTGSGALANITITNGVVTGVVVLGLNQGSGYSQGDVLSASAANLGGTGSGFTWTVSATQPTCPTNIADGFFLPNVSFSNDPVNFTNQWVIDYTWREKIGSIDLTNLNPGPPLNATDMEYTALNTRNAGSAIPPMSIGASLCSGGILADGCALIEFGLNSNPVSGVKGYIPYFYGTTAAPTLTTGTCSASAWTGGNFAGKFTAPTCAAGTIIISSLPPAPHGYICFATDQTTPTDTLVQTNNSTTSCTLKSTTVNGDTIGVAAISW